MAEPTSVTLVELTDILSSSAGVKITPDQVAESTTFKELGVDSLTLLGAIPILERTRQIVLPVDAVAHDIPTPDVDPPRHPQTR